MLGAIIGDMAGSVYEENNIKYIPNEILDHKNCCPTDDSVMTVAVARALVDSRGKSDLVCKNNLINSLKYFGTSFIFAGYGKKFMLWLLSDMREPYNSLANGSAMRVSPCGWLYDSMEETLHYAELSAEVTHNHPEGIKGAKAIAACIYLARTGKSKDDIRKYVEDNFYSLDFTLDGIRKDYYFDASCHGSCPQAIEAFLESDDFVHAIKLAISIGGDSDTIAAMTGSIAEAYYGIPEATKEKALKLLDDRQYKDAVENYSVIRDEWERFTKYQIPKTKEV